MKNIKIEKGIPLIKKGSGRPSKFPFDQMEIGDSFLGDQKAAYCAYKYGLRHNKKFTQRAEGNNIRIFRIK